MIRSSEDSTAMERNNCRNWMSSAMEMGGGMEKSRRDFSLHRSSLLLRNWNYGPRWDWWWEFWELARVGRLLIDELEITTYKLEFDLDILCSLHVRTVNFHISRVPKFV